MKIEIDFNKKEIVLLEPTSLKDLTARLGELGVSDFKIVPKEPETVLTTGYHTTSTEHNLMPWPNTEETVIKWYRDHTMNSDQTKKIEE